MKSSIPLSTAFVSLLASILGSNATPLSARGPQTVNPYLDADQSVSIHPRITHAYVSVQIREPRLR